MKSDEGHEIHKLISNITVDTAEVIEALLEKIDCPCDFRGLRTVISLLEHLAAEYKSLFFQIFEFDSEYFKYFTHIKDTLWKSYTNNTPAKGWKSSRPLYALLFTIGNNTPPRSLRPLLTFIKHYLENETTIKSLGRVESSVRAFRLLFTDPDFDTSCLNSQKVTVLASRIELYRDSLDSEQASNVVNYCRELTNFYRLNWKTRHIYKSYDPTRFRSAYSRQKIERVFGSDNLFTLGLNKQQVSKFDSENGVEPYEEYPTLSIVEEEPISNVKPLHEESDISTIIDERKKKAQQSSISKNVQQSHNISPLHRTVIQPHELAFLWHELVTVGHRKDQIKIQRIKSIILLTLFLGKSLNSIFNLKIIANEESDDGGIYVYCGNYYLKVVHAPTAQIGPHTSNDSLLKTRHHSNVLLPTFMVEFLLLSELSVGSKVISNKSQKKALADIKQFLKNINRKYQIQLGYKRIRYFLVNRILANGEDDMVLIEHLQGTSNYYTRSMRHYTWYSDSTLNIKIYKIWTRIFKDIRRYVVTESIPNISIESLDSLEKNIGTGSQFTPTKKAIEQKVNLLIKKIEGLTPFEISSSIRNTIDYHNNYTVYTLYMLLNGSGYRAVHNPLPHFNLSLSRYNALCISDKDEAKSFSHSRIIAAPNVLQEQLQHYLVHLNAMGNLLNGLLPYESSHFLEQVSDSSLSTLGSKKEKLDWFFNVKHSRSNDGLFVFLPNGDEKDVSNLSKNFSPALLRDLTEDSGILPINFGRHYLRTYLEQLDVSQELINFQLGHWVAGELPLGNMSTFEYQEGISELKPVLDSMMMELGWKAVPSLLTRKRS